MPVKNANFGPKSTNLYSYEILRIHFPPVESQILLKNIKNIFGIIKNNCMLIYNPNSARLKYLNVPVLCERRTCLTDSI